MKSIIKKTLQSLLGFDTYLFLFSKFVIKTLRWNKNESDFLHFLSLIPENGVVLDIGANIGIMTVHLAQKLPSSTIHAIEPMPANLNTLRKIVDNYNLKNVVIHEFALGNQKGTIEMVMPIVDEVKMQGLSHVVHDSIETFNEGEKVSVAVKTLDDTGLQLSAGKPINAIKMDVENFEYFVLEGGKSMIEKHKPIIYTELWDNENRQKCFDFIRNLNYKIMVLSGKRLVQFDPEKQKTQNFFFIPE